MKLRIGDNIFNLRNATVKLYNNEVNLYYITTGNHGDKIAFASKELAKEAFEAISTGFAQGKVLIEFTPVHQNKL